MFKKVNNLIFTVLFLAVLFVPLLFTRWESGGVSEKENRNLARFPALMVDNQFNQSFTKDFESRRYLTALCQIRIGKLEEREIPFTPLILLCMTMPMPT